MSNTNQTDNVPETTIIESEELTEGKNPPQDELAPPDLIPDTSVAEDSAQEDSSDDDDDPIGKKKFPLKRIIIIGVIVLAVAAAAFVVLKKIRENNQPDTTVTQATVERRSIENTISGSSTMAAKDSYSVTSMVTGEIISDTFSEGDVVKKGDTLYQIDSDEAQNNVRTAQNSLAKAQISYQDAIKDGELNAESSAGEIQSAQNALTKAQLSYNDALDDFNDLSIKSPSKGTVSEVFVKKGDEVASGTKIATIYDDSTMKLEIPFNENDALSIWSGEDATLTVVGTGDVLTGRVSSVSTATVATESHANVRYVTVYVTNPGSLTTNDKATAIIGDVACADSANFENSEETTITAKTNGTLSGLYISENDAVYANQSVASIQSDTLDTNLENARLSLDDAQISLEKTVRNANNSSDDSSIQNALLELDNAKISLEKAQTSLEDYTITAPIDGTIVTKNKKAGDKMDNSNSSSDTNEMCIIYDLSSLKCQIDVDETEVLEVETGDEVKITADALEGEWTGVVQRVGVDGTSSNGVTTYPVDVTVTDYGDLLPGMNVTAEIVVSKVDNALAVPITSVNRGNIVYVLGDKTDENDKAPDGYKSVTVETGISDEDYIEITSGLEEGQTIVGADLSTDTTNGTEEQMPGAMGGGGMPGGGGMAGGGGGGMAGGGGGGAPGGGGGGMR